MPPADSLKAAPSRLRHKTVSARWPTRCASASSTVTWRRLPAAPGRPGRRVRHQPHSLPRGPAATRSRRSRKDRAPPGRRRRRPLGGGGRGHLPAARTARTSPAPPFGPHFSEADYAALHSLTRNTARPQRWRSGTVGRVEPTLSLGTAAFRRTPALSDDHLGPATGLRPPDPAATQRLRRRRPGRSRAHPDRHPVRGRPGGGSGELLRSHIEHAGASLVAIYRRALAE